MSTADEEASGASISTSARLVRLGPIERTVPENANPPLVTSLGECPLAQAACPSTGRAPGPGPTSAGAPVPAAGPTAGSSCPVLDDVGGTALTQGRQGTGGDTAGVVGGGAQLRRSQLGGLLARRAATVPGQVGIDRRPTDMGLGSVPRQPCPTGDSRRPTPTESDPGTGARHWSTPTPTARGTAHAA